MHGYSVLTLSNFDKSIRYGTYTIDMFKPPVNMEKRLMKNKLRDQKIMVTI